MDNYLPSSRFDNCRPEALFMYIYRQRQIRGQVNRYLLYASGTVPAQLRYLM